MPQEGQTPVQRFGVFEVNFSAQELRKHGIGVRPLALATDCGRMIGNPEVSMEGHNFRIADHPLRTRVSLPAAPFLELETRRREASGLQCVRGSRPATCGQPQLNAH